MDLAYPNALLGSAHRARYGAPPLQIDRMMAWCYRRLGIWVARHAGLPSHGMALSLCLPDVRGVATLRDGVPWPRLVLGHEVGHIMTGHTYGLELAGDDHRYYGNMAERAAANYAVCFLLDAETVMEGVANGWSDDQIGATQGLPGYAVERRMELAMLTGECGRLYRPDAHPVHTCYLRARGIPAPHWWRPEDEPA